MTQNRQSSPLLLRVHTAHEPVASAGVAATVGVKLDSSPARVGLVVGVVLPVCCAPMRATVSDGVHCFPPLAGADGMRSDWDRGYQSTRYALGCAKAGIFVACSWLKCRLTITPSSFRTSAQVGVQCSAPCGPHAPRLTALTGTPCACSNSSGSSASPAQSLRSLQDQASLGGSPLASWRTAVPSNRRLRGWNDLWNRKSRSSTFGARLERLTSRRASARELAA